MWTLILGAEGTGKKFIAEWMVKSQKYQLVHEEREYYPGETSFEHILSHSQARLKAQLKAADMRTRRDVVTINSFWDSNEVHTKVFRDLEYITANEKRMFDMIYHTFKEPYALTAPHVVVYTKASEMTGMNRLKLKSVEIHPDIYNRQLRAYDEFVKRIKIPVIEVDMDGSPEYALSQVEFGLNSLKASQITNSTIWNRELMF